MDFDIIGELLIRYPTFVIYLREKWKPNMEVHELLKESKNVCDLLRREVVCNILSEFGIQIKLAGLIKMYLHETCSEFCVNHFYSKCSEIKRCSSLPLSVRVHH